MCVPHAWTRRPKASSHLPLHPIPLGHPSALALSALFYALNLDGWSISHMVIYMFPQFIVIHTVKGFGIVNKAEIDVFLELSCFFHDPADVGNLISGCSAFSKTSLNNWKFTVHILLKPALDNFEHYFTRMWDECNCAVVWAFLGIAFLWDWNENWPFPVLRPLLSFPNLLAYWVHHFHNKSIYFYCLDTPAQCLWELPQILVKPYGNGR